MHEWDQSTDLLAQSVLGYAVERLKVDKDPRWGARPADELAAALEGAICPDGIGGHRALALFRDVLMHACRPMDSPLHLAYVATAPTPAANMFDLVVSASSIFGGLWEGGAGAIAAENETLAWLARRIDHGAKVYPGWRVTLPKLRAGRARSRATRGAVRANRSPDAACAGRSRIRLGRGSGGQVRAEHAVAILAPAVRAAADDP